MEYVVFKIRRGSSYEWGTKNTILREGEPGQDLDTDNFKIGDGITPWSQLPYFETVDKTISRIQVAVAGVSVGGSRFEHEVTTPSDTWVWNHNLGCKPPVVLFESSAPNEPVYTDVEYPDENTITVLWPEPTTGIISI